MKVYIAKRILFAVFAIWIAFSATFFLLEASPNKGAMKATMNCAATGEDPEQCRERYEERRGLDKPVTERYKNYMVNLFTFNWGWSESRSQPVTQAILNAWPYSAQYTIPLIFLSTTIAFALGLYSAYNPYTVTDYLGSFVAFFGISIPNFWFALMMIIVFGVHLDLLPTYYQSTIPENQGWLSWANVEQLLIPMFVLLTAYLAFQMRYVRAQDLEQKNKEFVKVAKSKGASQFRLMLVHVFRNAAAPLAGSFVGMLIGIFWAGSLIIEQIFSIPGLGLLSYTAIVEQDTPLILGNTFVIVLLAVLGNLLEDLAIISLDPRIDYKGR
jgi:peptide/nickel transport system permease protein